jgi:hypothetical protein
LSLTAVNDSGLKPVGTRPPAWLRGVVVTWLVVVGEKLLVLVGAGFSAVGFEVPPQPPRTRATTTGARSRVEKRRLTLVDDDDDAAAVQW